MGNTTFVQVYDCGPEGSRVTAQVSLGRFLGYALERLAPLEIVQLRNDLTVLGRARIGGRHGRWREYRVVAGAQAG